MAMNDRIYVIRDKPDGATAFIHVPISEYEWAREHALATAGEGFTASELEVMDYNNRLGFALRHESVLCPTCGNKTYVRIPIYLVMDIEVEQNADGFRDINRMPSEKAKAQLMKMVVDKVHGLKVYGNE